MPLLLRRIRKPKWYKHKGVKWLPKDGLQADALSDLKTEANKLSLWYVEDDKSNFERVVSGLSVTRDALHDMDYALIELQKLSKLNLKFIQTKGDSLDKEANDKWHRDVIELSAPLILQIAMAINADGEIDRINWKDLGKWIVESVDDGCIEKSQIDSKIMKKLENFF